MGQTDVGAQHPDRPGPLAVGVRAPIGDREHDDLVAGGGECVAQSEHVGGGPPVSRGGKSQVSISTRTARP